MNQEKITIKEKNIVFPSFEEIPVSTRTFIIGTNLKLNIKKLFDFLPITDYVIIPKKRGRKKKVVLPDPNKDIPDGSIITIDLANNIRGVSLKKKKRKETESPDFFRNSVTIVMIMDGKKINFKMCENGKFQMTGVKREEQAENCIKAVWNYIKDNKEIYSLKDDQKYFKAVFVPAMRNIDFSLGFLIDREKLDRFINQQETYYSLLETSIGYTGVNIKFPSKKSIMELKIKEIKYENNEWKTPVLKPYEEYLNTLKPKEIQKSLQKTRFNTFLVFQSGKVIMSSMCEDFARDIYYDFLRIIQDNYKKFEEKLSFQTHQPA